MFVLSIAVELLFLQRRRLSTRAIELINYRWWKSQGREWFQVAKRTYAEGHGRVWEAPISITQMPWTQKSGPPSARGGFY